MNNKSTAAVNFNSGANVEGGPQLCKRAYRLIMAEVMGNVIKAPISNYGKKSTPARGLISWKERDPTFLSKELIVIPSRPQEPKSQSVSTSDAIRWVFLPSAPLRPPTGHLDAEAEIVPLQVFERVTPSHWLCLG